MKKDILKKCQEVKLQNQQLKKQLEDAKFDAEDLQKKYDEELAVRTSLSKEKAGL